MNIDNTRSIDNFLVPLLTKANKSLAYMRVNDRAQLYVGMCPPLVEGHVACTRNVCRRIP
jgi:hypothetical protein